MFNFKFILYNLLLIIPYINGIKEASVYDLTTSNNMYKHPMITSTSKSQLYCGSCGFFSLSRLYEFLISYDDYINNGVINNYDISLNFLIFQILSQGNIESINCGSTCAIDGIEDTIYTYIDNVRDFCKANYDGVTNACFIESNWCPYTYGNVYYSKDGPNNGIITVPVDRTCFLLNNNFNRKNIIVPETVPTGNIIQHNGIFNLFNTFDPLKEYRVQPYLIYVFMPETTITCDLSINKEIITAGWLASHGCTITPNKVNHAVTVVGYGIEDGKKYLKILNSYGNKWGDNGFFYIELIDTPAGILNSQLYNLVFITPLRLT
jgi:hypothetical protein